MQKSLDFGTESNTLYSYTGDSNGAYKNGQNFVQISDQGFSHGGGSDKPTTTTNVEGYGNVFASGGLRDIWIDSAGKGVQNVYIHDNEGASISTDGVPVTEISFTNPPTVEMSEKIFDSIFDILSMNVTDSKALQYHEQTKENISIVHENATKNIDINHLISPIMVLFSGIVGVFVIGIFFILKVII
jgi:hypothetical protein